LIVINSVEEFSKLFIVCSLSIFSSCSNIESILVVKCDGLNRAILSNMTIKYSIKGNLFCFNFYSIHIGKINNKKLHRVIYI